MQEKIKPFLAVRKKIRSSYILFFPEEFFKCVRFFWDTLYVIHVENKDNNIRIEKIVSKNIKR